MNTPQRAASRAGWRVLAAAPAMTGSLLLLVFLSGAIAPWGPVAMLAWLCIGVFTLTRAGEAATARLLYRFRPLSTDDADWIRPVLRDVQQRCGLAPGSVDLYVITERHRNAYATGRRSLALTTRLIDDHRRGAITDASLACIISHEVGHLAMRHVRLTPMLAWLALPWRTTYRLGAKLVMPIAARQPRVLLAIVVVAAFSVAITTGAQQHEWASISVLGGLAVSTLAAPIINAAAGRASEYAADQFAAQAGYGGELARALAGMNLVNRDRTLHSQMASRQPRTRHRVRRLTDTSDGDSNTLRLRDPPPGMTRGRQQGPLPPLAWPICRSGSSESLSSEMQARRLDDYGDEERHRPEQVVRKLTTADRLVAEDKGLAALCRELGGSEPTYHCCRNRFGGSTRRREAVEGTPSPACPTR